MKKSGQGMPLNVIIIAVIVIIVLVVLVAIFTGQLGNWVVGLKNTSTVECETDLKGTVNFSTDCPEDKQIFGATDVPFGKVCCKKP